MTDHHGRVALAAIVDATRGRDGANVVATGRENINAIAVYVTELEARLERAEAALTTTRNDALEEAAGHAVRIGILRMRNTGLLIADAIRALKRRKENDNHIP
jgi:hypothetical protein